MLLWYHLCFLSTTITLNRNKIKKKTIQGILAFFSPLAKCTFLCVAMKGHHTTGNIVGSEGGGLAQVLSMGHVQVVLRNLCILECGSLEP